MKKIYSVMIMCVAALTSMLFVSCEKRDIIPTETVQSSHRHFTITVMGQRQAAAEPEIW